MAEADCLYFFKAQQAEPKAALAEPSHVCAWRPKQKLATRTRWVDSEYFNKCHETFALTLDWLRLLQLEKVILACVMSSFNSWFSRFEHFSL